MIQSSHDRLQGESTTVLSPNSQWYGENRKDLSTHVPEWQNVRNLLFCPWNAIMASVLAILVVFVQLLTDSFGSVLEHFKEAPKALSMNTKYMLISSSPSLKVMVVVAVLPEMVKFVP